MQGEQMLVKRNKRAQGRVVATLAASAGFGVLAFGTPAYAQDIAAPGGICNGVTNQLAHRGMVQPNLLKAAARQNAEQIATLTAERAALVTTQNSLTAQITAARRRSPPWTPSTPRWSARSTP
jgi:hypothetical protein